MSNQLVDDILQRVKQLTYPQMQRLEKEMKPIHRLKHNEYITEKLRKSLSDNHAFHVRSVTYEQTQGQNRQSDEEEAYEKETTITASIVFGRQDDKLKIVIKTYEEPHKPIGVFIDTS